MCVVHWWLRAFLLKLHSETLHFFYFNFMKSVASDFVKSENFIQDQKQKEKWVWLSM